MKKDGVLFFMQLFIFNILSSGTMNFVNNYLKGKMYVLT